LHLGTTDRRASFSRKHLLLAGDLASFGAFANVPFVERILHKVSSEKDEHLYGKVFTSASNRNMHQRIHKGVRPFHCSPCGVFFRQKAHLQKHQKTQGHLQAMDVFEKKKRDGILPPDATVVDTITTKKSGGGDEER
jgi:hypothetical protein